MPQQTIFVCGATGVQGGAVVHHLQRQGGVNIRATVRNPDSASAQALQSKGVTLNKGDWDNEDSIKEGLKGCTALFLNLFPDLMNANHEFEQGHRIMSIAKEAGVKHIVYSSAFAVNEPERLEHWDPNSFFAGMFASKMKLEKEVRNFGFESWTILRPGFFMTNFLRPILDFYGPLIETGSLSTGMTRETQLPLVDPNDIGKFGAAALLDPARFNGAEIELSSQLLGWDEVMRLLSQLTGRDLKVVYLSQEELDALPPTYFMPRAQKVMRDMSKFHDLEKLQAWGIPVGNFEEFLEREKGKFLEQYRQ